MKRLAACAAALLLAGCATLAGARAAATAKPAPPVQPAPGTVSPATYVAQAASIDLFVIRSSELALVRSPSASVRTFASRMIEAHQGTSAQLSFAGRRLDLLPPAAMLPEQQAMYDELDGSGDFDRTYLRLQRAVHGGGAEPAFQFRAARRQPDPAPGRRQCRGGRTESPAMLRRL